MPITSEYTPVQTACNGSLTAFSFSFPIFDTSDLKVYLKTVATGVKTLLTETTNYTVAATNNDYTNGGTVTTISTYSSSFEIIIERAIPYTQPTDLEESGRIPSSTLDDTHDRALMQIQQVKNMVDRSLVMPVSDDSALDMELPNEVDRASQFLGFDADGEPIAAQTITGGTAATAYMQTLLDDADAATARATLDAEQDVFTTQGDMLQEGASDPERLAAVAVGNYLQSGGVGAVAAWGKLALSDTGVKITSFSRSTSGSEVVTGVGFTSSVVIFLVIDDDGSKSNWSVGVDTNTEQGCIAVTFDGANTASLGSNSINITQDGSNSIKGLLSAIGADGFTVDFTLTGARGADVIAVCLP